MSKRAISELFTWRSAITESDLPALARLVAFVLSIHMNEKGDSCFPSLATIAREAGLSKSTVVEYLARLELEGWIERQRGGGRRATRYRATFPRGAVRLTDSTNPAAERLESVSRTARVGDGESSRPGGGHEDVREDDIELGSRSCYIDNCHEPVVRTYPEGGPWWCRQHLEDQL